MTSYQKLKEENKKLKQDIYKLIVKEKEIEGIETKLFWQMAFDAEEVIFSGTYTQK